MRLRKFPALLVLLFAIQTTHAQFLMDMVDTTKDLGKSMLSIYKKFYLIDMTGYMQPQFQVTQAEGAKSFNAGDFPQHVNNRFMLRRGRIRVEYAHFGEQKGPSVQFVFQFDGTERGVVIRDFWARIFENKYKLFAFSTGMFARPFGYEVNLSSKDRESPERGRMSQILMKTERDLGAMLSFEPRKKNARLRYLKIDAGFFNGQGLAAPADYDSHKDLIARVGWKPCPITKKMFLSGGVSILNGGFLQNSKYVYTLNSHAGTKTFTVDSAQTNLYELAPRKYYGADMQLKIKGKAGFTELRIEFIGGKQTGTANNTETPTALLAATDGYYTRNFSGAYICFLKNIFNIHHQVGVKYDWYDPNIDVAGIDIGKAGSNTNAADIKFSTLGFGYIWYITENVKLVLWYEKIFNEKTQLTGYTNDLKDDVFTSRLQFRF